MAISKNTNVNGSDVARWLIIGGLVAVAFFGAYRFASASSTRATPATAAQDTVAAQPAATGAGAGAAGASTSGGSAAGGCACCGGASSQPTANGVTGPQVEATAHVAGGVQAIAVKVTTVYAPNVIHLKAGVPAEITFGSAQGCTGYVQSQSLGFAEDLTSGPKVVSIKNPQRGTYDFACGMNMVHGKIVVD